MSTAISHVAVQPVVITDIAPDGCEQAERAAPTREEHGSRKLGVHRPEMPATKFRKQISLLADEYDKMERKVQELERKLFIDKSSENGSDLDGTSVSVTILEVEDENLVSGESVNLTRDNEDPDPDEGARLTREHDKRWANSMTRTIAIARDATLNFEGSITGLSIDRSSMDRSRQDRSHDRSQRPSWGNPPSQHVRQDAAWIARSRLFEVSTQIAIIANAVVLTISFDNDMKPHDNESAPLQPIETAFCFYFAIELAIKLAVFRKAFFFHDSHATWMRISVLQILDIVIVFCGLYDRVAYHLGGHRTVNLTFLRLMQLVAFSPKTVFEALKVTEYIKMVRRHTQVRWLVRLVRKFKFVVAVVFMLTAAEFYMVALALLSLLGGRLGDADPQVQRDVRKHWGSFWDAMMSLYMSVTGGEHWNVLSEGLWNVSAWSYIVLCSHIAIFQFVILNVFLAIFVQIAMQEICNMDHVKIRMRAERKKEYIDSLCKIFPKGTFTWAEFCEKISDEDVHDILVDLNMSEFQAMQLCHVLSENGQNNVHVEAFFVTAIKNQAGATKMDLMLNTLNIMGEGAHNSIHSQHSLPLAASIPTLSIRSLDYPSLLIRELSPDELVRDVQCQFPLAGEQHPKFYETCAQLLDVVNKDCRGGCGVVVTSTTVLFELQQKFIDFQVVDRDERFPTGYMTQRLRNINVQSQRFRDAMKEFTAHSEGDRWPDWHEAHGLPKDGYMLINPAGLRVKCAARLIGLPTPPYSWDNVGTRHLAGLAMAWALREHTAVVIIRSDRGTVHVVYWSCSANKVVASKLKK